MKYNMKKFALPCDFLCRSIFCLGNAHEGMLCSDVCLREGLDG